MIALAARLGMQSADADQLETHIRRYYTDPAALEFIVDGTTWIGMCASSRRMPRTYSSDAETYSNALAAEAALLAMFLPGCGSITSYLDGVRHHPDGDLRVPRHRSADALKPHTTRIQMCVIHRDGGIPPFTTDPAMCGSPTSVTVTRPVVGVPPRSNQVEDAMSQIGPVNPAMATARMPTITTVARRSRRPGRR